MEEMNLKNDIPSGRDQLTSFELMVLMSSLTVVISSSERTLWNPTKPKSSPDV